MNWEPAVAWLALTICIGVIIHFTLGIGLMVWVYSHREVETARLDTYWEEACEVIGPMVSKLSILIGGIVSFFLVRSRWGF